MSNQPEALRLADAIHCGDDHCECSSNLAAAELRRLYEQSVQMKAVLMKHIALYRVDDDAYDPRAEAQRIYGLEMGVHA